MNPLVNFCVISYVVLALAMVGKPCSASSKVQHPFASYTVTVINGLSPGKSIFLNCKSRDDDLGPHTLQGGEYFSWKFRENFLVTTLFWCFARTTTHYHASFNVFWRENQDWLSYRCNYATCIWVARDDGIYIKNIPQNTLEFVYKWLDGDN